MRQFSLFLLSIFIGAPLSFAQETCNGVWVFDQCLAKSEGNLQILRISEMMKQQQAAPQLYFRGQVFFNILMPEQGNTPVTPIYVTLPPGALPAQCAKLLAGNDYPIEIMAQGKDDKPPCAILPSGGRAPDAPPCLKPGEFYIGHFTLTKLLRCTAGPAVSDEKIDALVAGLKRKDLEHYMAEKHLSEHP